VPKSVRTTLNSRSKVLKAKNTIIRTFDLVPKVGRTDFGTRSKVLKALFCIIKTFDLVPKLEVIILALYQKFFKLIELVPVANF
jgi:hypothetical protein